MGVNLSAGGSLQWFRNELCKADVAAAKRAKTRGLRPADRGGRSRAGRQRRAVLPALSLRRADAARRSRRPRLLHRPDGRPQPRPSDPRDHGRRDLFDARQPGDYRGPGRAGPADSRLRRRLAQPACGGRSRPTSSAARWSRSTARKGRPTAWPCWPPWGPGAFKNIEEACAATIRVVQETRVNRAAKTLLRPGFPIYQQLYRSLKDDFKRIAALERR